MSTIAYDLPIGNFIAGLDATGHVSHVQHRKTHVTLHHNGGRLSHQGVLDVWKVRPASAHFNVDALGTPAQFVRVAEYAWATGSTDGNQRSISIEMCNQSLAPDWVVGEPTWRGAARLAGWLFARVIGTRPNNSNLVRHKYWSATACAGPHIDRVYNQVLTVAQQSYDAFYAGRSPEGDDDVALNKDTDWDAFFSMMERWYRFHSRMNGSRPTHEDGMTLPEMLTSIGAKQLIVDLDEGLLAEELQRRGVDLGGADINEVRQAFVEVLGRTTLRPSTDL